MFLCVTFSTEVNALTHTHIVGGRDNLYNTEWSPAGDMPNPYPGGSGLDARCVEGGFGNAYNFSGVSSIAVTATGSVVDYATTASDANGWGWQNIFRDLPVYSLIGLWSSTSSSITAIGQPFFVGTSKTLTVPQGSSAFLFLAENDGGFYDNSGQYNVSLTFTSQLPGPDCNSNGILDNDDITNGTSLDCDTNGIPDECEVDTDGDWVIDACDICPGFDDNLVQGNDEILDFCDTCTNTGDVQTIYLTAVDQGSYRENGLHESGAHKWARSVGGIVDYDYRAFFVFDLSSISDNTTGATLNLFPHPGTCNPCNDPIHPTVDFQISAVSTPYSTLSEDHDGAPGITIFNDLGNGTSYGTFTKQINVDEPTLSVQLSASAISDINQTSGYFILGIKAILNSNTNWAGTNLAGPEPDLFATLDLTIPEPDCNNNDIPDRNDIFDGTSQDCDTNCIPDECEIDMDGDGIVDACELCQDDPTKTDPGLCGCDEVDIDENNDGVCDFETVFTPAGIDVEISFSNTNTTITFDNVYSADYTTVTTSFSPIPAPPDNFFVLGGESFNIETEASFIGSATVCFEYDDTGLGDFEQFLRLFHFTSDPPPPDHWVNATIVGTPENPNPNTVNNIICGEVTSFSKFIIGYYELTDADGDGHYAEEDDCDDNDPLNYPGNTETCDGQDNDCDSTVDENFPDNDNDGTADCVDLDDDNDGVLDVNDICPFEDATGFDADGDGCIDTLSGLSEVVETLTNEGVIPEELQTSLLAKCENAEKSADKENICAAINKLGALINQTNAQRGKKITDEAADLIVTYTNNLITQLQNKLSTGDNC